VHSRQGVLTVSPERIAEAGREGRQWRRLFGVFAKGIGLPQKRLQAAGMLVKTLEEGKAVVKRR